MKITFRLSIQLSLCLTAAACASHMKVSAPFSNESGYTVVQKEEPWLPGGNLTIKETKFQNIKYGQRVLLEGVEYVGESLDIIHGDLKFRLKCFYPGEVSKACLMYDQTGKELAVIVDASKTDQGEIKIGENIYPISLVFEVDGFSILPVQRAMGRAVGEPMQAAIDCAINTYHDYHYWEAEGLDLLTTIVFRTYAAQIVEDARYDHFRNFKKLTKPRRRPPVTIPTSDR